MRQIFSLLLVFTGSMFSCTTGTHGVQQTLIVSPKNEFWLSRGKLTSDRIKEKFGSFGVEVVLQDEQSGIRLSNLYSDDNNKKITRTLALVTFDLAMDPRLKKAHLAILKGGSIGSTLMQHGFKVQKDIIYKGEVDRLPARVRVMMKTDQEKAAALMYHLIAKIGNSAIFYCTITEIYSPQFLTKSELEHLFLMARSPKDSVDEEVFIDADTKNVENNLSLLRAIMNSLPST